MRNDQEIHAVKIGRPKLTRVYDGITESHALKRTSEACLVDRVWPRGANVPNERNVNAPWGWSSLTKPRVGDRDDEQEKAAKKESHHAKSNERWLEGVNWNGPQRHLFL
jgi:uncharacterized protein YeaO (DUF488 family)